MQVPKGFIFAYALILGILYLILGFLELTEGFSIMFLPPDYHVDLLGSFIPGDLFGGFSTIVVGLVLIRPLLLSRKKYDALMYVLVGSALAVIFGVLYVLIGGANGLSAYMAGEKWIWTEDVFRFEVLLLPFSILLVPTSWSVIK
ncbi:MAG: hypothetical protein DRN53_06110, partial [Thermoprotei archaeon]